MVGQDLRELSLVLRLQKRRDRSLGKTIEGLVLSSEDRERSGTLKNVDQVRCLERSSLDYITEDEDQACR